MTQSGRAVAVHQPTSRRRRQASAIWPEIEQAFAEIQELRFARRPAGYDDLRLKVESSAEERSTLEALVSWTNAEDSPRIVALIGGPGSGKSFTAWMLGRRIAAAARPQPFYLSLAHLPESESLAPTDLYEVADTIYSYLSGAKPQGDRAVPPNPPRLFIVDDASLAHTNITIDVVTGHLQQYKDDRILLMMHDATLIPMLQMRGHAIKKLLLDGFDEATLSRTQLSREWLTKIEYDHACWPLLVDTCKHALGSVNRANSYFTFHKALRDFVLNPSGTIPRLELRELMGTMLIRLDHDTLRLLALPYPTVRQSAKVQRITPARSAGSGAAYPYGRIFTYTTKTGLVFANSAVYAAFVAETLFQNQVNNSTRRPLRDGFSVSSASSATGRDLIFSAYIGLMTSQPVESHSGKMAFTRSEMSRGAHGVITQLLDSRMRRSLMELCRIITATSARLEQGRSSNTATPNTDSIRPPDFRYLTMDVCAGLREAFGQHDVDYDEDRDDFIEGIDRTWSSKYMRIKKRGQQLASDLRAMNRTKRLWNGSIPLLQWLTYAQKHFATLYEEDTDIFMRALLTVHRISEANREPDQSQT